MHNLTPHQHGDHLVTETALSDTNDENSSILDWMQRMFDQDLGEGHLEHCVAADGHHTNVDWDFYLPSFLLPFVDSIDTSGPPTSIKTKPPLIENPVSRVSFIHLPLRAPPVLA